LNTKYIAIGIAIMFILVGLVTMLPTGVTAAEYTYWSSASPPSYNCSYWTVYPHYSSTVTEVEGPKVSGDAVTQDLYGTTGVSKWVKTNDFTDTGSWVDPGSNSSYIEPVGWMPFANATITAVYLSAQFTNYRPDMQLSFSVNDEASWTTSSTITGSTSPFMGDWNWNITTLATWTPELLNSTDLWARMKASPVTGLHYYLDYLGFVVYWWAELEGGGSGGEGVEELPGTDTDFDIDYNIIYSGEGIIGILGFVGFIGMIGVPALTIYLFRKSDEGRMATFIKMLVLFMFCLTCFMVSVSGA